MGKKQGTERRNNGKLRRRDADKHALYQWSVQAPDFEVTFIDKIFRQRRKRRPLLMREDFCGTALLAAEWVQSRADRQAIGLDLDKDTLDWARKHNLKSLGHKSERVHLLQKDVRTITRPKADVICAYNFSYFTFHPLIELRDYFKSVRRSLKPDGMFFMDCFGGWESQQLMAEPREVNSPAGKFTYVWDQADYNPIDNTITCHIHFGFAGGKRMKKAFTYNWRLYSPAEIQDTLAEVGFRRSRVFWDQSVREDTDDYRPAKRAENTPGWLVYIVGEI